MLTGRRKFPMHQTTRNQSADDYKLDWPEPQPVTVQAKPGEFALDWPEQTANSNGATPDIGLVSPTPPPVSPEPVSPAPVPEPLPAAVAAQVESPDTFVGAVQLVARGDLPASAVVVDDWAIRSADIDETFSMSTWRKVRATWDALDKKQRKLIFEIVDRYESLWWDRHGSFPEVDSVA